MSGVDSEAKAAVGASRLVYSLSRSHDTSSAMIEKHYSAYIIDAMDELAARAVVSLVSKSADIVQLRR